MSQGELAPAASLVVDFLFAAIASMNNSGKTAQKCTGGPYLARQMSLPEGLDTGDVTHPLFRFGSGREAHPAQLTEKTHKTLFFNQVQAAAA